MNQYVIVVGREPHRIAGPYADEGEAHQDATRFADLGYATAVHPLLTGAEMHQFLVEESEQGRQSP